MTVESEVKRHGFSGLKHQSSRDAGGFHFKVIQYLFLPLFLASYLIQSLLGCPGSRNGKLVNTVSMNASIKHALANAGNENGKEAMA